MKSKSKSIICITLIIIYLLFFMSLRHVTVRYVDQDNASIAPDLSTRFLEASVSLKQSGYHLKRMQYHHDRRLLIVTYRSGKNVLAQVKKAKYVGVTFQPTIVPITNHSQTDPFNLSRSYNGNDSGRDTLRILVGDSFDNMKVLNANYPAVNVRDPSIMKQGKRYYIIYTRGLMYTKDFNHWHQVSWPTDKRFIASMDWAPEFVRDHQGNTEVIMSVCDRGSSRHQLAIASFKDGHVQSNWTKLTGNLPENTIDPNLQYAHGKYWLCCKNEKTRQLVIGTANKISGPYQMSKINIKNPQGYSLEGPEALINRKHIRIFFDTYKLPKNSAPAFYGLHYVEYNLKGNKNSWSGMKPVQTTPSIIFRHGQIVENHG